MNLKSNSNKLVFQNQQPDEENNWKIIGDSKSTKQNIKNHEMSIKKVPTIDNELFPSLENSVKLSKESSAKIDTKPKDKNKLTNTRMQISHEQNSKKESALKATKQEVNHDEGWVTMGNKKQIKQNSIDNTTKIPKISMNIDQNIESFPKLEEASSKITTNNQPKVKKSKKITNYNTEQIEEKSISEHSVNNEMKLNNAENKFLDKNSTEISDLAPDDKKVNEDTQITKENNKKSTKDNNNDIWLEVKPKNKIEIQMTFKQGDEKSKPKFKGANSSANQNDSNNTDPKIMNETKNQNCINKPTDEAFIENEQCYRKNHKLKEYIRYKFRANNKSLNNEMIFDPIYLYLTKQIFNTDQVQKPTVEPYFKVMNLEKFILGNQILALSFNKYEEILTKILDHEQRAYLNDGDKSNINIIEDYLHQLENKHLEIFDVIKAMDNLLYMEIINQKQKNPQQNELINEANIKTTSPRSISKFMDQIMINTQFQLGEDEFDMIISQIFVSTPWNMNIKQRIQLEIQRLENDLPIYSKKNAILEAIKHNQFLVISAETGSGKSTQIPQYILEADLDYKKKILVVQPRKLTAVSLANRVALETNTKVNEDLVCYKISIKDKIKDSIKIVYATDDMVLKMLLNDRQLSQYSCIIVDEVHERKISMDIILSLMKKLGQKRKDLKVLITSASFDKSLFTTYFQCPLIRISGRKFPISIRYIPGSEIHNIIDEIELLIKTIINPKHKTNTLHGIEMRKYIKQDKDTLIIQENNKKNDINEGHILVFLPGIEEIEKLIYRINNYLQEKELYKKYIVLPLHGQLSFEEQLKIFEESNDIIKIICSTKIAENSITIKNIRTVIDSGIDNEAIYDPIKKMNIFVQQKITKDSAEQRAGRAGRTCSGKCYRLYSEDTFKNIMKSYKLPEIQRLNLDLIILKIKLFNYKDISKFEFIEKPDENKIEESIMNLIQLGALDSYTKDLTNDGRYMAEFNVDPSYSKAILHSIKYKCIDEVVMIVAMLNHAIDLFIKVNDDVNREKIDIKRLNFSHSYGDLLTLLTIFKNWKNIGDNMNQKERNLARLKWCTDNLLNPRSLIFANSLYEELKLHINKIEIKNSSKKIDDNINDNSISKDQNLINLSDIVNIDHSISEPIEDRITKCFLNSFWGNICIYSGNCKIGYILLKEDKILQLHECSSLMLQDKYAEYMLCIDISKHNYYLSRYASIIKHEWLEDKDMLTLDYINDIKKKLKARKIYNNFEILNISTALLHIFNNKNNLKIIKFIEKYDMIFDVNFVEEKLIIYSTLAIDIAKNYVNTLLNEIQNQINDDYLEHIVTQTTKAIITDGCIVNELIISASTFIDTISLIDIPAKDRNYIRELAYSIGIVSSFKIKTDNNKRNNDTLIIQYASSEHADIFMEIIQYNPQYQGKIKREIEEEKELDNDNNEEIIHLKLTWYTGKSKGISVATFKNTNQVDIVMQKLASLTLNSRKLLFKRSMEGKNMLIIENIPYEYEETLLKEIIEKLTKISPINILVLRDKCDNIDKVTENKLRELIKKALGKDKNKLEYIQILKYYNKEQENKYKYEHNAFITIRGENTSKLIISKYDKQIGLLGNQIIRIQQENIKRINILREITSILKDDIEDEFMSYKKIANDNNKNIDMLIYNDNNNPNQNYIKLTCDDLQLLENCYENINNIIKGKYIELINEYQYKKLNNKYGEEFLKNLEKEYNIYIELDHYKYILRIYTSKDQYTDIINKIKNFLKLNEFIIISLKEKNIKNLLINNEKYMNLLRSKYKNMNIYINIIKKEIELIGLKEDIINIENELNEYISINTNTNNNNKSYINIYKEICEICFDNITECYTLYNCKHKFCYNCLQLQIQYSQNDINSLPIKCAKCIKLISVIDIKNLVDLETLKKICDLSLRIYLNTHSKQYGICPSKNCENIYKINSYSNKFKCNACKKIYCTNCRNSYHENYQCWEVNDRNIVAKKLGCKLCPNPSCGVLVYRISGCAHVTCTCCKKHFCWECNSSETLYDTALECYLHMKNKHNFNFVM